MDRSPRPNSNKQYIQIHLTNNFVVFQSLFVFTCSIPDAIFIYSDRLTNKIKYSVNKNQESGFNWFYFLMSLVYTCTVQTMYNILAYERL